MNVMSTFLPIMALIMAPITARNCEGGADWVWDRTHTGLRPDCPIAVAASHTGGYLWHSIRVAKDLCEAHPTCNYFQRYDGGGPTRNCATCYGHNYFHSCPDLNNITWIPETRWGIGAPTTNNYQLQQCIEGPTAEPTPEPTFDPTTAEELPCQCYDVELLSEESNGEGIVCYEYQVTKNANPPALLDCTDDLEFIILGRGKAPYRCNMTDLTSVVTKVSGSMSDIQSVNTLTFDVNFGGGDGKNVRGIQVSGVSDGDSFEICFDEAEVYGTMRGGRIGYKLGDTEYKCPVSDTLPDLCPEWKRNP